jgi:hypothetical protein
MIWVAHASGEPASEARQKYPLTHSTSPTLVRRHTPIRCSAPDLPLLGVSCRRG